MLPYKTVLNAVSAKVKTFTTLFFYFLKYKQKKLTQSILFNVWNFAYDKFKNIIYNIYLK